MNTRAKPQGGRPRRDDIDPARVRQLRDQGLSLREIARQLGAGYGTIRKILGHAEDHPQVSENLSVGAL